METGTRLHAARKSLLLSLEAVNERTGIGISTLSELENGKREPSIRQLSTLAKTYHRSMAYFLDEAKGENDPVVLWREQPDLPVAREQEAAFRKLCEQYRQLEAWCGDSIRPSLPQCEIEPQTFARHDAERLARHVRTELSLGDYPAYGLLSALENTCGIKVFHETFEPTGTAACLRSESVGMAVLLNAANAPYRRNFDLAHELFHLLTWNCFGPASTGEPDKGAAGASEAEEKWAGVFATSLLIPTEALQEAVGRKISADGGLRLAVLPTLAEEFGVSVDAMAWRIHNVYQFGKDRVDETKARIRAAKQITDCRLAVEGTGSVPPKYPKRYMALATQALVMGKISTGKFCEFTGWERPDAMNLVCSEEVAFDEIQVTAA